MAFRGRSDHSLDDKNRVVLPLGLRKEFSEEKLKEGFVLVAGIRNQCLELHPLAEWVEHEKRLEEMYPPNDEAGQDYLTDLYSTIYTFELDKQYRFLIPDGSRDLAGIHKEVCLIGRGTKVLIYSRERWEARAQGRGENAMVPPPTGRQV